MKACLVGGTCYVKNNIESGVETRQYVRKQFHRVKRARTSDGLENSFIVVVYNTIFISALDRKF